MLDLQILFDTAADVTVGMRRGSETPDALWSIEFLTADDAPLRPKAIYLLTEAELPALAARAEKFAALFFVSCAGDPPALPEGLPDAATVVFVRLGLPALYARLNRCLDLLRLRRRIDDIVLMASNAQYTPEQLVTAFSQLLSLGVFILNGACQRISGAAAAYAGNPYAEELQRTGALSAESVRAIRDGRPAVPAMLYEAESGKWSRFNVLLLWRPDLRLDAPYLCRRLADYVVAFRSRNAPPDIPPFLIDQRLNRMLEGKTTDEAEIRSFFGAGSGPVWFAVLVLGYEPGIRWNAEAYLRQAQLLRSAFRNAAVTVANAQVCAVVHLPLLQPKDSVYSRSFFTEHAYAEGWDAARLEHELQQCGVYLCYSSVFQTPGFFPVMYGAVADALGIAIRMDGCRGRRIVEYQDYHSYFSIQYAVDRFLQKYDPRSLRAVLHPEVVTLLLHDIKYRTDLADVLYAYYVYGDANRAAQALFVHRNTIYNKLKTIQKILCSDIDAPDVRSSYFTSLQVFYYCEKCLGLDLHSPE